MVLAIILLLSNANTPKNKTINSSRGSWRASAMLFVYALFFSYSYISLDTGTGALILFGTVQITMISVAFFQGNKPNTAEWVGVLIACGGFTYLMLPGVTAPSLSGFLLMLIAGVAWGFYTLAGKGSENPLGDTCFNFVRTLPAVLVLCAAVMLQNSALIDNISLRGAMLATLSGGIASGVGYTLWYAALRGLTNVQAAVLQLLVPVIATLGGIVFANEPLSTRFLVAATLVLGGILIVILSKRVSSHKRSPS